MTRCLMVILTLTMGIVATATAQETTQNGEGSNIGGDMMNMLLFLGPVILIFYFIVFLPQMRQKKKHEEKLRQVKSGTRIMTAGGIHGTCRGGDESKDTIFLEVAKGVKIEISRNAVASVIDDDGKGSDSSAGK